MSTHEKNVLTIVVCTILLILVGYGMAYLEIDKCQNSPRSDKFESCEQLFWSIPEQPPRDPENPWQEIDPTHPDVLNLDGNFLYDPSSKYSTTYVDTVYKIEEIFAYVYFEKID